MKLSIEHETVYRYEAPVRSSTQYIRLTPRRSARQAMLQWQIDTPRAAVQTHDGYGNVLHVLTLDKPVREIRIRAHGVVDADAPGENAADGENGDALSPLLFLRSTAATRPDEAIGRFAEAFRRRSGTGRLRELALAIRDKARPGQEQSQESGPAGQSSEQAFTAQPGSLSDQVHLFIACCHHLGIPARYVSGYLLSHIKDEPQIAQHAWAEAWIAERWHGFDLATTSSDGHLKLAIGADYLDACPIRGIRTGGGLETMEAHAKVSIKK